jgi:NAD+ kinase
MTRLVHARHRIVALYVDVVREYAREKAREVADVVRHAGFRVAMPEAQNAVLELAGNGVSISDADLLVTIGGDGTLLRGARLAAPHGIPLFGINAGRLGFLTEVDGAADVTDLPVMLERGFSEERRVALCVEIDGRTHFALNDIVVRKGGASRIVPFTLELNHEEAAHVPCDGIVVATPTGSTAYFLSAGGPIIAPDVEAFGIVPLMPHTLFSRPIIVSCTTTVTVSCDRAQLNAVVEADGEVVAELASCARVVITKYPKSVRFARREPLNFFTRLEHKFNWGKSIRETSR